MTQSKRRIRRRIGRHKIDEYRPGKGLRLPIGAWSLPGLLLDLHTTRRERHVFIYGARLADGRTPAQALDDGDDLAVLRHLRDASSSALKSVSVQ
jgi:hypothetical protein